MIGAALWLFDEIVPFGNWLRAALAAIAAWIGRNPLLAAVIALLCLSGWLWHRDAGHVAERDAARAEVDAMNARTKAAAARIEAATNSMAANAATITKGKNDEMARTAAARDALLEQLRGRPSRASASAATFAGDGSAPVVGTGSSLFSEDAGFLVREAARADDIRSSLIACYAQYEDARQTLERLQKPDPSASPN